MNVEICRTYLDKKSKSIRKVDGAPKPQRRMKKLRFHRKRSGKARVAAELTFTKAH